MCRKTCMISITTCMTASDQCFPSIFVSPRRNKKAILFNDTLPDEIGECHISRCASPNEARFISTVYAARRTLLFRDNGVTVVRLSHIPQKHIIHLTLFPNAYWKCTTPRILKFERQTSRSGGNPILSSITFMGNLLKSSFAFQNLRNISL